MNIDLKKKINELTKDRNRLITEVRSTEENRARWEQKCKDIIRTSANVKKKKIILSININYYYTYIKQQHQLSK